MPGHQSIFDTLLGGPPENWCYDQLGLTTKMANARADFNQAQQNAIGNCGAAYGAGMANDWRAWKLTGVMTDAERSAFYDGVLANCQIFGTATDVDESPRPRQRPCSECAKFDDGLCAAHMMEKRVVKSSRPLFVVRLRWWTQLALWWKARKWFRQYGVMPI